MVDVASSTVVLALKRREAELGGDRDERTLDNLLVLHLCDHFVIQFYKENALRVLHNDRLDCYFSILAVERCLF